MFKSAVSNYGYVTGASNYNGYNSIVGSMQRCHSVAVQLHSTAARPGLSRSRGKRLSCAGYPRRFEVRNDDDSEVVGDDADAVTP